MVDILRRHAALAAYGLKLFLNLRQAFLNMRLGRSGIWQDLPRHQELVLQDQPFLRTGGLQMSHVREINLTQCFAESKVFCCRTEMAEPRPGKSWGMALQIPIRGPLQNGSFRILKDNANALAWSAPRSAL